MRILAVDFGDSRTGLAISDTLGMLASPLSVIHEKDMDACVQKVAQAVKENTAEQVVVGNPLNMNGTAGPRSEKAHLFADKLRALVSVPVVMWDERRTTVAAHNIMNELNRRGKKRKETIDAAAAALILENYLAFLSFKNRQDKP
jgi:putative Holliday junction resolvase